MNLSDDKNILLAKKAVYAEQLFYYSKLCQSYQDLAEYAKGNPYMTTTDIEKRYAEPLSRIICSNNLEQTLQELSDEHIFTEDYMGKKYSKKELSHFSNFAKASNIFKCFQKASGFLDMASKFKGQLRDEVISKLHSYMRHPNREKTVQNFDELISVHSPRYLGSRFFLIANKGLNNINKVDQSHIPLDNFIISESLTPEKFGAIITGYKTIERNIEHLEEHQPATEHYSPDNWDLSNNLDEKAVEAKDEFSSLEHSFKESAYVVGSKAKRAGNTVKNVASTVYNAHKGTIKKAVLIAAAVAAIVGGANQVRKEAIANNLDINSSTQYEQTVSDETKQYINNIMAELNLQRNAFDPQYEDVKDIESNIDLVLDYIVRDQVTSAFEEYHEGYTVTEVETWFNKKYQGSVNDPHNYRFVDISYIDDKGNEGSERINEFKSEFLLENPLNEIFELEETIDLNSPVWSAFNDNGTRNFLARAETIEDVMQYLEDAAKLTSHVAAFSLEHGHSITGTPYLKSTLPESIDKTTDMKKDRKIDMKEDRYEGR